MTLALTATPYSILLLGTALLALAVAVVTWRRQAATPARVPFIGMMLAIAGYALVAALEAAAVMLRSKLFFSTLEYVASGATITCFLIFVLYFTNTHARLSSLELGLVAVLPMANVLLVATNPWHGLVWRDFVPGPPGSNALVYVHGPGFYWVVACVYTYLLLAVFLLLRALAQGTVVHRRQVWVILAATAVPFIGTVGYALGLTPPGLNVTPMSFAITGVLLFVGLFRYRLFDLVPIARSTLIEQMPDAVLVVDGSGRVIDANPAATLWLSLGATLGMPLAAVVALPPTLLTAALEGDGDEPQQLNTVPPRYVSVQRSPLADHRGVPMGYLLVLHDVTAQHTTALQLRQVNEELETKLDEIHTLQAELRAQAFYDALTGLFNRRYAMETLQRELLRSADGERGLAVVLFDLDHFKSVNDTYGHATGDLVLQAFGAILLEMSRERDIACRYGGEEFLLALPQCSEHIAWARANAARQRLAAVTFTSVGGDSFHVTLSAGVAAFPTHGTTLDALLGAADHALYRAKSGGRNRVFHAITLLSMPNR